jgi:hypothetical protein
MYNAACWAFGIRVSEGFACNDALSRFREEDHLGLALELPGIGIPHHFESLQDTQTSGHGVGGCDSGDNVASHFCELN